jgi:methylthioribulose-1-phosphate dehydratase
MNALIEAGRDFYQRGWSLGTSSNYSEVISQHPLILNMTASGFSKGHLTPEQFVRVDEHARLAEASQYKPSAEAALHTTLARVAGAGAVLHTHSVAATILSEAHCRHGFILLQNYEMLKGLAGIQTHEASFPLTIFPNTQGIAALAIEVEARLEDITQPLSHGFLLAGHGLYAWGKDVAEARRHIEIFEFLLEVILRRHGVSA